MFDRYNFKNLDDYIGTFQTRPVQPMREASWSSRRCCLALNYVYVCFAKRKSIDIERLVCQNCTEFDTAHCWVLRNTPAKHEVGRMKSSQDMQVTNKQTEIPCFIFRLMQHE